MRRRSKFNTTWLDRYMDLFTEINQEKNDPEFIQSVDTQITSKASITIKNVNNIKDKEDEIS